MPGNGLDLIRGCDTSSPCSTDAPIEGLGTRCMQALVTEIIFHDAGSGLATGSLLAPLLQKLFPRKFPWLWNTENAGCQNGWLGSNGA